MLLIAIALAAGSPCSAAETAEAAAVSPLRERDFAEVGLSNVNGGFRRPMSQEIGWSGTCAPTIVGLYGGIALVMENGTMLWTRGGPSLSVREDQMVPSDPEPAHPYWPRHRFVGSASLAADGWRVGLWVRSDGITDVARYRPGERKHPVILMTSAKPIVGLFYLGAPDSVGGTLFLTQRLGQSRFRMLSIAWSEGGLRTR
ncbi:hypothetical protein ABDK56_12070 [Sphingomonas sp. ASV193]|uniref:hypothetical protein n=1 Tax=Sphingomonas sp. ASV193 TaxID=3144405 RepID=UPI0032E853E0